MVLFKTQRKNFYIDKYLSFCFTASTCDSGWVGHVFHTKCYRIMRNANTIPKMPHKRAMSICKMEGGSVAELNDGYKGNYLLMTLLKSIKEHLGELPPKGQHLWTSI